MKRVHRLNPPMRLLLGAVLALCLAVRLLAPAGFMPSFASGSLAIVECPDADGAPLEQAMPEMAGMDMTGMAMPGTARGEGKHAFHQSCPYASAASLAGLEAGLVVFALLTLPAALPPLAQRFPAIRRRATRERPPSRGPPIPA